MTQPSRLIGAATIGLALAFNLPYALLASSFDYPGILRQPAATVLTTFARGGAGLILTWHAFALAAFALVPLAPALAITATRLQRAPALAIAAAINGALAGLTQAIGLWRWVFVVPHLARAHADPATARAAELAFDLLNAYGGVAIGEHLGQGLTALFAATLAALQRAEGANATALTGFATAATLAIGTTEGLAIALGHSGAAFSAFTIAGFLGLTLWLLLTGRNALRRS